MSNHRNFVSDFSNGKYHISDMIPVALPKHVAGAGLTRSLFLVPSTLDSTIHCVSSLSSINSVMYAGQIYTCRSLIIQYTLLKPSIFIIVVRGIAGIKPEDLSPLLIVNLYKFCKRDILIQPPGEPREQHLGDVRPKKFELHKIYKRRNDRKG